MAETKADLIKKAHSLGIKHVNSNNTMVELRRAIAVADPKKHDKESLPTEGHEAKVAKAGKRSAKSIKESEEKLAKEERKARANETVTEEAAGVRPTQKPARTRLERSGRRMKAAAELVDKNKEYSIKEAVDLAIKTSTTKFDGTVEMHVRLSVDPKQADQNIREIIVLPHGTGKTVRVAVFGDPEDVANAKKAGADIAGSDDFLQQLEKGVLDFDVLIATPMTMPKLGKYAKVLGPKGLMPNPKSGTVTKDVARAVADTKAGRVEYRVDSTGIVHLGVGRVSFGADKLAANVAAFVASVKNAKPASVKGSYVKSVYMTTSMGPSIKVASSEI
jgi:large subunit ribosomal protein L1